MKNDIFPYQVILFEGIGATELARERRVGVTKSLLDKGYSVTRVTGEGVRPVSTGSSEIPMLVLGDFEGNAPEDNPQSR